MGPRVILAARQRLDAAVRKVLSRGEATLIRWPLSGLQSDVHDAYDSLDCIHVHVCAKPVGNPDRASPVHRRPGDASAASSRESAEQASEMLRRLQSLPWRRIDVSFKGARFGFAHNNIQVGTHTGPCLHAHTSEASRTLSEQQSRPFPWAIRWLLVGGGLGLLCVSFGYRTPAPCAPVPGALGLQSCCTWATHSHVTAPTPVT